MPEFAAPQRPTRKPHDRYGAARVQPSPAPLGPGRPLDGDVRSGMEVRFGHDFSRVRVHSDEKSAATTRTYDALAYTTGSDIVFSPGQYRPDTATGRWLLAHELAHVVQQASVPSAVQAKDMSTPGDAAERAADAAAHIFGQSAEPARSLALDLRDTLRATRAHRPMVQRAVPTWAGEFDTDKYDTVLDGAGKNEVGVDIELRFKPGKHVDAELIGMVQMVTSKAAGKAVWPGASATLKARSIPAGKDAGANIDRLEAFGNPLYATDAPSAKDKIADTPTAAGWGQHGWRFTDKAGKLKEQDALLKDRPLIDPQGPDSSQVFETTAVAVKGVQEGAWYGSVQWGWRSDAANKFSKLPLTAVSKDVPSGTFSTAADLWAAKPTSTRAATLPLPMIMGKYANAADVWLIQKPSEYPAGLIGKLAKNTRLEVTDKGAAAAFNKAAKSQWWKVTSSTAPSSAGSGGSWSPSSRTRSRSDGPCGALGPSRGPRPRPRRGAQRARVPGAFSTVRRHGARPGLAAAGCAGRATATGTSLRDTFPSSVSRRRGAFHPRPRVPCARRPSCAGTAVRRGTAAKHDRHGEPVGAARRPRRPSRRARP